MAKIANPVRVSLCALVLAGAAGAADVPDAVKKLSGASEETAASVMTQQGYVLRNQKTSWGRDYRHWWSDKRHQCVQLMSLAGRVAQVSVKGESDCRHVAVAGPGVVTGVFDPLPLTGQPRAAAEQQLIRAGFTVLSNDMSKGDATYVTWTNGRQCLGGNIVNDRYERFDELPKQTCAIK